jgi:hypothetical protein
MFKLIKDCLFAWKYRRAVKRAIKLSKLYGMKFYVIYMNGRLKVVPKKTLRNWWHATAFARG